MKSFLRLDPLINEHIPVRLSMKKELATERNRSLPEMTASMGPVNSAAIICDLRCLKEAVKGESG